MEKLQDVILTESLFQFSDIFSISNFINIVLYYYVTDIFSQSNYRDTFFTIYLVL